MIKKKDLKNNGEIMEILKAEGILDYNITLLKRYPEAPNLIQKGFIERLK